MKKLAALLMLVLLTVPASALMAGCTSNNTRISADELLNYVSGITGFKVRLNVSVRTTISDAYTEGSLHYRTYSVDVHVESYGSPVAVASRNITNPRIDSYVLWDDAIGPWYGMPWNYWLRNDEALPQQSYTSVETGSSESDPIYEIPKPGMFIDIAGNRLSFHEVMLDTAEQVATYLKIRVQDDGSGNMLPYEFKIPLEGIIPEWSYPSQTKTVWYDIEIYCPVGGSLFEAIPDLLQVQCFDTHQSFKCGYSQTVYDLSDYVTTLLMAFSPPAGLLALFGSDWGSESYIEVGTEVRPHGLEAVDVAPDSSEVGRSFGIAVRMW